MRPLSRAPERSPRPGENSCSWRQVRMPTSSRHPEAAEVPILVVDDEAVIREAMTLVLSGAGYTDVRSAANGVEAVALSRDRTPALCILDLRMPGMDGLQVMAGLQDVSGDMRFVIVTACAQGEDDRVEEALARGASAVVYKPFQIEDVMKAVRDALGNERERVDDALGDCLPPELADSVLCVIPCGVLVLDTELAVIWANEPVLGWLGRDEAELLGRRIEDVLPADLLRVTGLRGAVSAVAESGGGARLCSFWRGSVLDVSAERLDGGQIVLGLDALPGSGRSGDRFAHGHLAALSQFVGGLAHEVNNPLAGAAAYAQILASRAETEGFSEASRRALQIVEDQTARAARVIEDLLVFAGQVRRGKENVDLSAVARAAVTEAIEEARQRASGSGIQVEAEWAEGLPPVRGDSQRIKSACAHLVRNALEACGERGKVTVDTQAAPGGDVVEFVTADSGPGLAPEDMRRVFDPFFTTKESARGLGLPAVYGVAAEHGGTVRVQSSGAGATFTLSLPAWTGRSDGEDD